MTDTPTNDNFVVATPGEDIVIEGIHLKTFIAKNGDTIIPEEDVKEFFSHPRLTADTVKQLRDIIQGRIDENKQKA